MTHAPFRSRPGRLQVPLPSIPQSNVSPHACRPERVKGVTSHLICSPLPARSHSTSRAPSPRTPLAPLVRPGYKIRRRQGKGRGAMAAKKRAGRSSRRKKRGGNGGAKVNRRRRGERGVRVGEVGGWRSWSMKGGRCGHKVRCGRERCRQVGGRAAKPGEAQMRGTQGEDVTLDRP